MFETVEQLDEYRRSKFIRQALADNETAAAILPSSVQARLVTLADIEGGAEAYNLPWAVRVTGKLSVPHLQNAFRRVICRHEQLARRFLIVDGHLLSLRSDVLPAARVILRRGMSLSERNRDALRAAECDRDGQFAVFGGHLVRLTIVDYGEDDHLVLLSVHHALADGPSLNILVQDLSDAYSRELTGTPEPKPTTTADYTDFVLAELSLSGAALDEHVAAWDRMLAGAPPALEMPTDYPRRSHLTFSGDDRTCTLAPGVVKGLSTTAANNGATPFMATLALFGYTLGRYSGVTDVVIGVPVDGRPSAAFDDVLGMFVNTVPVRLQFDNAASISELIQRTAASTISALEHKVVPLDLLVSRHTLDRSGNRSPLFQVAFNYLPRSEAYSEVSFQGCDAKEIVVSEVSAKFEISATAREDTDGSMTITFEYSTELFDSATADRLLDLFQRVATVCGADPEVSLSDIPIETTPDLVPQIGSDVAQGGRSDTITKRFAKRVAQSPRDIAVEFEGGEWTFAQLNDSARRIAVALQERGIGPGDVAGVMMRRGPTLVAAMLGVLQAGAAYVPIDPNYPVERVQFMLSDSRVPVVLLDTSTVGANLPKDVEPINVMSISDHLPASGPLPVESGDGAYVLYTSGSTGDPKGALLSHAAVLAMVDASYKIFGVNAFEVSLATTSVSFDAAVLEIFPALCSGGTVRLVDSVFDMRTEDKRRPHTFMFSVPSLITAAASDGTLATGDGTIAVGGERLTHAVVSTLYASGASRVVNIYGPTEGSTYSTTAEVQKSEIIPTIGIAAPGRRVHLLDDDDNAVPLGAVGEIVLSGAGLADGYLHRPALTASRFVPDPFSSTPGKRMYRTGDFGRYGPDGRLVYVGRIDRQVKINGIRVELAEVENALLGFDEITECVVVVNQEDSGARLMAFIVSTENFDTSRARRGLQGLLPQHLIPARVTRVPAFPRLPNGKVDLRAPMFTKQVSVHRSNAAPEVQAGQTTTTVTRVMSIWRDLLPSYSYDPDADFFEVGGNSLLALRLSHKLQEIFSVSFGVSDVFKARTPEGIAELLNRSSDGGTSSPVRSDEPERSVLSREQYRLWFVEQLGAPEAYEIPVLFAIDGQLDIEGLRLALKTVVEHHDVLTRRIRTIDGQPSTYRGPQPVLVTRQELGARDDCGEIVRQVTQFSEMRLQLEEGPLFAAKLVSWSDSQHLFLAKMHHIIADGWSVDIFLRDLASAYYAHTSGIATKPRPNGLEYGDYAAWQAERIQSGEFDAPVNTWRRLLDGAPTLLAFEPRATSASSVSNSSSVDRHYEPVNTAGGEKVFTLSRSTTLALTNLQRRLRSTPFVASSFVFALAVAETCSTDDVLIGTPIAGRERPEFADIMGMFVNMIALRLDARGNPSIEELADRYLQHVRVASSVQDTPLDMVVEAIKPERAIGRNPLFQVTFAYEYPGAGDLELVGLQTSRVADESGASKFDLAGTLWHDACGTGQLTLEFGPARLDVHKVTTFARRFEEIALAVSEHSTAKFIDIINRVGRHSYDADSRTNVGWEHAPWT